MTKRTMQLLLLALILKTNAIGQINCSNSTKLVCQIPFSTGVFGTNGSIVSNANSLGFALNSAIATQVSQLPLASASAGTVLVRTGAVDTTLDNLGPILTDRAQTIGKNELFLAFTASQFVFTDIDGIALKSVPFSYSATSDVGQTYISESLNIHFKINQYVAFATYGVTSKFDLSMILPIERVSIGSETFGATQYLFDNHIPPTLVGVLNPSNTFSPGTASGIGDIVFNAKYGLWNQERAKLAAEFNLRAPTGDARNYLGSGAWGFNPYLVFTYLSKTSPHVKLGYQWNTETELNPNPVRSGNHALPGGLEYDIGVDRALKKRVTVAADLLGNQYLNAQRLYAASLSLPGGSQTGLLTVTAVNSSYWINDVSAGVKWNPYRDLILTGNVLFQLNNVGMRARPTPLLGISYKWGLPSRH